MSATDAGQLASAAGVVVHEPAGQRLPVVLASPHSGADYPESFLAQSRLEPEILRRSEDSFVDEIFAPATLLGIPQIKALFPRAYLDTNREAYELDPDMFVDPLPAYANTRSPRVAAGLGTIAKVVAQGVEIYGRKLQVADALDRIERHYKPYHQALRALIDRTVQRFGYCVLIDCHSMPSGGGPGDVSTPVRKGSGRAGGSGRSGQMDFVLGDCYGQTCAGVLMDRADQWLTACGYRCTRNTPYAGGYTTRHYGRPKQGVHALQLEVNRALYMDERAYTRKPYQETLAAQMRELIACLGQTDPLLLRTAA